MGHSPSRLTCKKRTYRTELDAKIALASTQRAKSSERSENRVYRCGCGKYHLSSQPKRVTA